MIDEDDIERLVAEEIARPEVKKLIADQIRRPSLPKRVGTVLRHPVVLTILGFALTSIVGTFIGQEISARQLRDTQLRNALVAVRSFATTGSELRVAQNNFQETLERDSTPEELATQKQIYDAAFSAWSSGLYANALATREFFGFTYDNFAEQAINRTLHQSFKSYRECLRQGYEVSLDAGETATDGSTPARRVDIEACLAEQGVPGLQVGETIDRRERLFQCSRTIFDTLNHYISRDLNCTTSSWKKLGDRPSNVSVAFNNMVQTCGNQNVKPFQSFEQYFDKFCTIKEPGFVRGLFR